MLIATGATGKTELAQGRLGAVPGIGFLGGNSAERVARIQRHTATVLPVIHGAQGMQWQGTGAVGLGQFIAERPCLGGELVGLIQFFCLPNSLGGGGRTMECKLYAGEALPVLGLLGV